VGAAHGQAHRSGWQRLYPLGIEFRIEVNQDVTRTNLAAQPAEAES